MNNFLSNVEQRRQDAIFYSTLPCALEPTPIAPTQMHPAPTVVRNNAATTTGSELLWGRHGDTLCYASTTANKEGYEEGMPSDSAEVALHKISSMLRQQGPFPFNSSTSLYLYDTAIPDQGRREDRYSVAPFSDPSLSSFSLKKLRGCCTSSDHLSWEHEMPTNHQKEERCLVSTNNGFRCLPPAPTKSMGSSIMVEEPVMERFSGVQNNRWQRRFDDLIQFCNDYGNCCVPTTWPQNVSTIVLVLVCII
jgi:hypothetical protein